MKAFRFLLIAFLCLAFSPSFAATTLLPNGQQCFANANGPLVSGSLNMFYPATTTPKPTWQDANQNTLNTQPIQLDANGCAIIYGVGSYRQQVYTGPVSGGVTTGTLVWDQLTTDTSAYNAVFWSGLAGGTPNVITVVDTGFNATDGTVINFVALATNTGSTTINPSSFGAIPVVKDTAAGPVSLAGGEIVQNNIISVVYSATSNNFHLLNTAIPSPSGNTAPLCGASGLIITNDSGTPGSIIDVTANQILTQTTGGQVFNRSSASFTINISNGTTTSTAGGMDGESPGSSSWLYLWAIDNGSAVAGLASLASGNGLSPNMPSGYTYKCRVGAARVFSDSTLVRFMQGGNTWQYIVNTAVASSATPPTIANGTSGTYSTTSPVLASVSITGVVPPTANAINVIATGNSLNNTGGAVLIAPSTTWSGTQFGPRGTSNRGWPLWIDGSGATQNNASAWLIIENPGASASIGYTGSAAGSMASALGYKDSVNAN